MSQEGKSKGKKKKKKDKRGISPRPGQSDSAHVSQLFAPELGMGAGGRLSTVPSIPYPSGEPSSSTVDTSVSEVRPPKRSLYGGEEPLAKRVKASSKHQLDLASSSRPLSSADLVTQPQRHRAAEEESVSSLARTGTDEQHQSSSMYSSLVQPQPGTTTSSRPKVVLQENLSYSETAQRIMASMGYKEGKGLGRTGAGIVDPIEESMHKGRRGLGYVLEGLEKEDVQWEQEEVSYVVKPEWLDPCTLDIPTEEEMGGWIKTGERKTTIADETLFCDSQILAKILEAKGRALVTPTLSTFDNLSEKEFLDARQRSNPFETIRGAIFQNRAAMKMANIDAEFEFMFSQPKKPDGSPLGPWDVLYFADICAGPGGFSEYMLWRKKWHAKGFGMTLKDPGSGSDFKLDAFLAAPCETFDPHYGVGGYDGDGDITRPDNLIAFHEYVVANTENEEGVHFVMADGGISVEGQENIQEILTKQLVLCQYICALSILKEGGNFVCKVFDMFTPFSVGLFYLLYRCFHRVCIYKPVTSRPANSERYIVCHKLRPESEAVRDHLFYVNEELCRMSNEDRNEDVIEVVPLNILIEDTDFSSYVTAFNDSFGFNQHLHLKKLQYYVKNMNLQEMRQSEIRTNCLMRWKVPTMPRTVPEEIAPVKLFNDLWKTLAPVVLNRSQDVLKSSKFETVTKDNLSFLRDVYSWRWMWACGKRLMIVGMGCLVKGPDLLELIDYDGFMDLATVLSLVVVGNKVHGWDMVNDRPVFSALQDLAKLELPRGTVLEVEQVEELTGEGQGQRRQITLYIVDVIAVYGELIANKAFKERMNVAELLCKVLNKPCRKGSIFIKSKVCYRVEEMRNKLDKLSLLACKGHPSPIPTFPVTDVTFFAPVGVVFFKVIRDPWQLHHSKSAGRLYYFNKSNGKNSFECPPTSVAPYISVLESRHFWQWNRSIFQELCGKATEEMKLGSEVTRSHLTRVITDYLSGPKSSGQRV